MIPPVVGGVADVSVGSFIVTKERSEVVGYTDTLGFAR
jgi:hypothetical protein